MSAAIWLRVSTSGAPSSSACRYAVDELVDRLGGVAVAQGPERRAHARAVRDLVQGERDLLRQRTAEALRHPPSALAEADAGAHRHGEHVEEVRQVAVDRARAARGPRRSRASGMKIAASAISTGNHAAVDRTRSPRRGEDQHPHDAAGRNTSTVEPVRAAGLRRSGAAAKVTPRGPSSRRTGGTSRPASRPADRPPRLARAARRPQQERCPRPPGRWPASAAPSGSPRSKTATSATAADRRRRDGADQRSSCVDPRHPADGAASRPEQRRASRSATCPSGCGSSCRTVPGCITLSMDEHDDSPAR